MSWPRRKFRQSRKGLQTRTTSNPQPGPLIITSIVAPGGDSPFATVSFAGSLLAGQLPRTLTGYTWSGSGNIVATAINDSQIRVSSDDSNFVTGDTFTPTLSFNLKGAHGQKVATTAITVQ